MAEVIALFPLGTVLVPGRLLPLHVFEPRYRALLRDLLALAPDRRCFGVVAIRLGSEVGPVAGQQLYTVGTASVVRDVSWLPDGRAHLVATGGRRFRVREVLSPQEQAGPAYQQAVVEWLPEAAGAGAEELAVEVAAAFARYRAALGSGAYALDPPSDLPSDPVGLSYAVAARLALDTHGAQLLLEAPDATTRLRAELDLLRRETALGRELPSLPAFELPRSTDPN